VGTGLAGALVLEDANAGEAFIARNRVGKLCAKSRWICISRVRPGTLKRYGVQQYKMQQAQWSVVTL